MSGIRCFEDILSWQKARILTRDIYCATRTHDFARDFGLASQIQRASVSIMSNIAEGFERDSNREFLRFLSIAKASCAEVRSQLYIAHDIHYIDEQTLQKLLDQATEIGRLISGLRSSVQRRMDAPAS